MEIQAAEQIVVWVNLNAMYIVHDSNPITGKLEVQKLV